MASTSPSPTAVPPTSTASTPPPSVPSSPPLSIPSTGSPPPSTTSPPPSTSQPNQTSDPPGSSTPRPLSAPPRVPASPPPSPPQSTPPPTSPPPSPPASPPPSPPASPPPSPPTSAPPPSPPTSAPPPSATASAPPPSVPTTPPPAASSPPPPVLSSPPPSIGSPPPQASPTPPAVTPPPARAISPSPPPPSTVRTPPPSNSPPPPQTVPPENSPPSPVLPPPPVSLSAPPPVDNAPPVSTSSSPPPSVPSSSSPPPVSPPAPPGNSSNTSPLPSIPTQKPIAKPPGNTNTTVEAAPKDSGGLNTGTAVAICVAVGFIVLSLVLIAAFFVRRQKKRRNKMNIGHVMPSPYASSQNSESSFLRSQSPAPLKGSGSVSDFIYSSSEQGGVGNSKSWFTYDELIQATDGFSTLNLLGEGGFGCVYKGVLADGREVAVKQLKIGGGQGEREFRAEVEIISRVHHRHLVSLVGYCISEHQRLLVYDYVPNNTLHYHLHDEGRPVMDWATRVKVAAGAARGIAYLHEDCHPRIIHRDIKSSNILLDNNFDARVSDFGLAKLALDSYTHVTTRVMGTFGYMAPEYATSGKLTEKSDVYSFGVVLLELITGRKPVDTTQPMGDESLVEWARPLLAQALDSGNFEGLTDPRLEKNYIEAEMFRMIEAAAASVRHSGVKRPRMGQVVRALDSLDDLTDLSNGMRPGQSEVYDSAQHSAQIRMFRRMAFGSQDYSTDYFNRSHSSWGSREHNDQTRNSWMSREQGNQGTVINMNSSGNWNNRD
ncbi:hypothetical protein FNV43_RR13625 [Rhamnella rubrinervis]|uniref:non-specific serine/threonine protein kinase n=1 Tax=Rhamnella rubrinervis TaxID=2594499 RepID=A0A8K0H1I8_9ROSA|nr:hypothetical protein FNV43_RR13625 [Rhamnella rubrinervis]